MNHLEIIANQIVERVTEYALRTLSELSTEHYVDDDMLSFIKSEQGAGKIGEKYVDLIIDNREEFDEIYEKVLVKRIWYMVLEGFGKLEDGDFIPFNPAQIQINLEKSID